MLVVGLTGGIGSGKTTVAALFAKRGVPIIDADQIARHVTSKKHEALQKIVNHFTSIVLQANGELDRAKLRDIVFNDANERKWLENLLHPLILQEMTTQIAKLNAPYCILVIPLLIEVTPYPFINRILVVDSTLENQLNRTMKRDRLIKDQVAAIIQTQENREKRLQQAHDVIINDGVLGDLEPQVEQLHHKYLKICKN